MCLENQVHIGYFVFQHKLVQLFQNRCKTWRHGQLIQITNAKSFFLLPIFYVNVNLITLILNMLTLTFKFGHTYYTCFTLLGKSKLKCTVLN